jgi:hypothetical protein
MVKMKQDLPFYGIIFLSNIILLNIIGLIIPRGMLYGQPVLLEWERRYGGDSIETISDIKITSDGGFILLGSTKSYEDDRGGVWLVKTDGNGDTLWTKTFSNSLGKANFIDEDFRQGYIISSGVQPAMIIKTNSNGDSIWAREYNDATYSDGSFVKTVDSCYIINTCIYKTPVLVKINKQGDTLWERAYDFGANWLNSISLQTTTDGGFSLVCYNVSGAINEKVLLVKFDSNGELLWQNRFGIQLWDPFPQVLVQARDAGFLIVGSTFAGMAGTFLVKTDSLGDTLWRKEYVNINIDDILPDYDGGYLFAGTGLTYGNNLLLSKINLTGDTLWTYTRNSSDSADINIKLQKVDDTSFVVVEQSCLNSRNSDLVFMKYKINNDFVRVKDKASEHFTLDNKLYCDHSGRIELQLEVVKESFYNIKIYGVDGKMLGNVFKGNLRLGRHRVILPQRVFVANAGMYYLQINDTCRKILLVK